MEPPEACTPGEWSFATLDDASTVLHDDIVVDDRGGVHVVYVPATDPHTQLRYAYLTPGAGWSTETVDDGHDRKPSEPTVALTRAGSPRVAYRAEGESGSSLLTYASRTEEGWSTQSVGEDGNTGWFPSLVLDGEDSPLVTYLDRAEKSLRLARRRGGRWETSTLDEQGWRSSAAWDSRGLHVAYCAGNRGLLREVRYGRLDPSGGFATETVATAPIRADMCDTSLALATEGHAYLAYRFSGFDDSYETEALMVASRLAGGDWLSAEVFTTHRDTYTRDFGLAMGPRGAMHLVHHDHGDGVERRTLLSSTDGTGRWATRPIATATSDMSDTELAIAADGRAHVVVVWGGLRHAAANVCPANEETAH
jgi:hypothetical protein